MDTRYIQRSPEDQLVEECAELILAIQKLKRFGQKAKDPFTLKEYNNLADVRAEISDVKQAIHAFLVSPSNEMKE